MTKKQASLCERLKQMGFRQENQMRLYGKRRPLGRLNVALRVLASQLPVDFRALTLLLSVARLFH